MSETPIPYDGQPEGPETPVATIFCSTVWKNEQGAMIEENVPPFGFALPESVPRFIGIGTALAQQLGAPEGQGVTIPYRFVIVADSPTKAFAVYAEMVIPEGQKAYQRWVEQQAGKRILAPGQMNGRR